MAAEQIREFFARVEQDEALQQQLNTMLKLEDSSRGAQIEKFIGIAAEVGFSFTKEEYEEFEEDIVAAAPKGEVSDSDLENVSGGICVFGRGGPFNNCKVALLLHVY